MKIIRLGHGSSRIEVEDLVLLVDPWLNGNPVLPVDPVGWALRFHVVSRQKLETHYRTFPVQEQSAGVLARLAGRQGDRTAGDAGDCS